MIPIIKLLYKIDFKLNKLSTLAHQEIPVENKLLALNEAQIKLIKSKVNPDNKYTLGFESFKKRYEDLQGFIEPFDKHPLVVTLSDSNLNKYIADLTQLNPTLMFYVDSYALATKDGCINRPIYVNHDLTKNADVSLLLSNSKYAPSFEYQETFNTLGGDKIAIYSDGTFTYSTVYVAYLRYPIEMDFAGYTKLDGTPSKTTDCELPAFLEDELINFTIEELGFDTENQSVVQASDKRIQTQE